MKKELLYGLSGLIIGGLISGAVVWAMMGNQNKNGADSKIQEAPSLQGKTGNAFDKIYLSEMITHHEMAIDMAQEAMMRASHAELKAAAKQVADTQTKEINQMKAWQVEWGYNATLSDDHTSMHH